MEFLVPVPDHDYYLWQMLVQVAHFREMGFEPDAHFLVVYFDQPSDRLRHLYESDELGCYIHAYPDTREDKSYSASMKPWLLAQYFDQFPDESSKVFNYLDPDVMFTKPMDFTPFEQPDGRWFGSDTRSYTGAQYIREKGEQLFVELCEIADVSPDLVLEHDQNSIGAQYFIKGAGADFWRNVERNSVRAYKHMIQTADEYKPEGHEHPIQAWCAEMYMQQFETVRAGFTPIADERLQFHWADADASTWAEKAYFHNAGQTQETGKHFCKITWQTSPFHQKMAVSPESASSRYVDLIRRTEQMFPDLVWSVGAGGDSLEQPSDDAEDYVRAEIPDERVYDLAGREVTLTGLTADHAALLIYTSTDSAEGLEILQRIPAQLVSVPHLRVHTVLTRRAQLVALPPEARRLALLDTDGRTHQEWGIKPGAVGAVLLGRDGQLAGGPVHGPDAVEQFANDIRNAIVSVVPEQSLRDCISADHSLSMDVLIPFRNAAPERLRNLIFTIGYYRQHLPTARIILAEHNDLSHLPEGVVVDRHITVPGDPDLFNRSLLLNAAAAESTAAHLVFADADCIPEVGLLASLEGIAELLPMTYIVTHNRVHYLSPGRTDDFIAEGRGHNGDVPMSEDEASHVTVGGMTFCSAELFHVMGGFDQQRFLGWGGEDDDLYNRCLVSPHATARIDSELVHLNHPGSVWHTFTENEMVAKRSRIPSPALRAPASRVDEAKAFFAKQRVALATNTHNLALHSASRRFSEPMFPNLQVVDGTEGTYGRSAFAQLFADPRLDDFDYVVYTDEDNFIVDWPELRSTLSSFIEGGYGFAGMPDGGVISHRFHNPVAINPFLSFFDLRRVREALAGEADVSDRFGLDLVEHWPASLVRRWDGEQPHPRVSVVLNDGHVPFGTALDDFEPHYALWFRLLRVGLRPLYLAGRDAPEMDDDGCCTAILSTTGRVMAYHSWFARAYQHDLGQTIRINKVIERARSHLRW